MTGPAGPPSCGLGALRILGIVLASRSITVLNSERILYCVERIEASLYLRGRCCITWVAEHVSGGILSQHLGVDQPRMDTISRPCRPMLEPKSVSRYVHSILEVVRTPRARCCGG